MLKSRLINCGAVFLAVLAGSALVACPDSTAAPAVAGDPAQIATDLVADEQTLHDAAAGEGALQVAALRQQAAYRAIGRHSEWDPIIRPKIPAALVGTYDLNIDARRHLDALNRGEVKSTLPAWRIDPPTPGNELIGFYRDAEAATGVGWNYLAAINMVETGFGRINGNSSAGAQGPMQFLPSTFAGYGQGGDVHSPRDSIMAAGRMLAANGFAGNHDQAIFAYNHSGHYVAAVNDYAAAMGGDPAAFGAYHRWDTYYGTTAGDVLLPIGYAATERIPASDYLATHPQ